MSVPEGFHTITPYLVDRVAAQAIELWVEAFGAEAGHLDVMPEGRICHAQIHIGNSQMMVTGGSADCGFTPPIQHLGRSPLHFFLYVEDADAVFARAGASGMDELMAMSDQSYGRTGRVKDRFGFLWWFTTAP